MNDCFFLLVFPEDRLRLIKRSIVIIFLSNCYLATIQTAKQSRYLGNKNSQAGSRRSLSRLAFLLYISHQRGRLLLKRDGLGAKRQGL